MNPHTLVVGAGVSGLASAHALLRHGHRVTVLDRGAVGAESSWAGGGILSPLLPWDYAEPVAALALQAMAGYPAWISEIEATSGLQTEYWRCGMLALRMQEMGAALDWCDAHGLDARRDGPRPLPLAAEALESEKIWLPDVAQVRNPRLVAALRAAVVRLGGAIHEARPATALRVSAGHATAVDTPGGALEADTIVIASGAWAGLGLAGLAATPNVRPIRGQMLLYKLEPDALDTILYADGLYLIPRRDGHLLVGSTVEDAGFDKTADAPTAARLAAAAASLMPVLSDRQPIRHWAGLRPGAPQNIPVIDRHPDFENVFVNAGHFRYGVTMAPTSAEMLLSLIEGTAPPLDPAPYSWRAALARAWDAR